LFHGSTDVRNCIRISPKLFISKISVFSFFICTCARTSHDKHPILPTQTKFHLILSRMFHETRGRFLFKTSRLCVIIYVSRYANYHHYHHFDACCFFCAGLFISPLFSFRVFPDTCDRNYGIFHRNITIAVRYRYTLHTAV